MKKLLVTLAVATAAITTASAAMTHESVQEKARFLTDRMAYELNLTPEQIEDCYEINYDFIASINPIMDDVVYGNTVMTDHYYDFLNYRNEDLRYIMTSNQYLRFMALDYFCRPIYTTASRWLFSIYDYYTDPYYYYYGVPRIYNTYRGFHSRYYYPRGFYGGSRYHHAIYHTPYRVHRGSLGRPHYRGGSYNHRGYAGNHRGGSYNHHNNAGSHRSGAGMSARHSNSHHNAVRSGGSSHSIARHSSVRSSGSSRGSSHHSATRAGGSSHRSSGGGSHRSGGSHGHGGGHGRGH